MHNLSFWEEPDWRRESTLNPNFIMGVIIALFAIAGLGVVSFTYTSTVSLSGELSGMKVRNEEIASKAEKVKLQKERTRMWTEVLEKLENMRRKRLVLSRQLAALQAAVPSAIVLDSIGFHVVRVDAEMAPATTGAKENETVLRYGMSVSGSASGDNAQAAIVAFANRLRPGADSVIGRRLLSSELKNISGGRGNQNTKSFRIECTYKAVE